MTELALVLPVFLMLLLGVADYSRVLSTVMTVGTAAREAADYGTMYPWLWTGDPSNPASNAGKTVAGMKLRACTAASTLTDYQGPDSACANPRVSSVLDPTPAGVPAAQCASVPRGSAPCYVTVTLTYTFRLVAPVRIRIGDVDYGLPASWTFQRSSTFAISDFAIDQPTASPR